MGAQGTAIAVFIPTVTGAAAWTGARESRRRMLDLLAVTPRPRWIRQLTAWAATTAWSLTGYLLCIGVLYAVTATQAGGGPLWWPVVVGAACAPALSALGFTAGTLLPSRYTPPLVAIGVFLGAEVSLELIHGAGSRWQVSPLVAGAYQLGNDGGLATFYRYLPDLSIVQLIFLAGFTAALLGVLGLAPGAGGRWLRRTAAALTAVGVLAAGAAIGLAGTGQLDPHGMIAIPALHDAADDRPVAYTPVCSHTSIPVCLHPAYTVYLSAIATDLRPVLDAVAGLPGAPVRIGQAATTYRENGDGIEIRVSAWTVTGTPPVYWIVLPDQFDGPTTGVSDTAKMVERQAVDGIVTAAVGPGTDPAQQAVRAVLLGRRGVVAGSPVDDAAIRFAALPTATRHAWLVAHAADLRAGRITLGQLP
jgi:hypothetical protein